MTHTSTLITRKKLDELYRRYNQRQFVHPDPLEFIYNYPKLRDRELVGLIASSLAYGRVTQILKSVRSVLDRMTPSPFLFLQDSSQKLLHSTFSDFRHRFTTGDEMASMLWGVKRVIERYGSLYQCFMGGMHDDADTVLPALSAFVMEIKTRMTPVRNSVLPSPDKGSACKRLNLFLRWMVREDEVDPGGWGKVPLKKLIVPLDTHMYRICRLLELTGRRSADMRTALEITYGFRRLSPDDPARYDFALTRLGIRSDTDLGEFINMICRDE